MRSCLVEALAAVLLGATVYGVLMAAINIAYAFGVREWLGVPLK